MKPDTIITNYFLITTELLPVLANRQLVTVGFNMGEEKRILEDVAMTVPSTGSSTNHAWLTQIPGMREWLGDRLVNNIESDNMTVTNRLFEGTIEMPRADIEDDQHGIYRNLAALQGDNMTQLPMLVTPGFEAWKTKESKVGEGVPDSWGDWEERGINWETLTAITLLESGADIIVLRHPVSIQRVKTAIQELMLIPETA